MGVTGAYSGTQGVCAGADRGLQGVQGVFTGADRGYRGWQGKHRGWQGKNREFSYEQGFLEPVVYVETPLKKNNHVDCKIS